jgi:hypothetical protein
MHVHVVLLAQMMIKQSVRREAESRSHYELLVQVLPAHIIQRLAAGQAYIPEQHEQVRSMGLASAERRASLSCTCCSMSR